MKKLKIHLERVSENTILTAFIAFVIFSILIFSFSYPLYENDLNGYLKNLIIEAHGILFDIAILGILLFWINKNGDRQKRIRKYLEEIEDIRFWHSAEASYKILGNVKRLGREKIHKLDLHNCFLRNINLSHLNLTFSNLNYSNLSLSSFIESNLMNTQLNHANLENSNLNKTNFKGASLNGALLTNAKGIRTHFANANLIKVNFSNAFFIDANFHNTDLSGADFNNASFYMPDFSNAKGLTAEQLSKVKVILNPKMDELIFKEIQENFPQILLKPIDKGQQGEQENATTPGSGN
jgi:hypothetical protein